VISVNLLKLLTCIIDKVNQFINNVTKFKKRKKKEYLYCIKMDVSLALKKIIVGKHGNGKKKVCKANINNQSFIVSHPIKTNNNEIVFFYR